jgi:ABC-type Co2+ transport system permease subunit
VRYDSSDGIADNQGWPVGYYQWQAQNENNIQPALCAGTNTVVGECHIPPPTIDYGRVALNFIVWLAFGTAAGAAIRYGTSRKNA